jgi:hypothetical protein
VNLERRHRRRRHRVDGVEANQLLDVQYVTVIGVLRAGARPEEPLRLRAALGQRTPPRAAEQLLVALVGQLRIGNRHFALKQSGGPGNGAVQRCS